MKIRVQDISELPTEETKGHQGFTARALVKLADRGVTVRMLRVSPGGLGPVPAHQHADVHFFLVLDGRLAIAVDGVVYQVSKGECIEVPANRVHQLRNDGDKEMSVLAVKWG
jgi:mannose-6-phosphate isomerase-like protein (cupin superfamily)